MNSKVQQVCAGVLALLLGLSVASHGLPVIVSHFMVDDSFYYLKIAENIARGNGFTFDGLHRTNGFQPLFQLMLVPLFWLPLDPRGVIYAEKVLEAVLFSVTAVLLYRLGKQITGSSIGGWLTVFVLFLPGPGFEPLGKGLFAGMESGIDAVMILLVLGCWMRLRTADQTTASFVTYGLLLGALLLARLDNAFLIAGIGIWHASRLRRHEGPPLERLLVSAATATAVALAYLAWNRLAFGGFLPVSAAVKLWESSRISQALLASGWLLWLHNTLWFVFSPKATALLPWIGLLGVPALFLLQARAVPSAPAAVLNPNWGSYLSVLWVSSALKILCYAVFEQSPLNQVFWYYVQEVIELGICAGVAGTWVLRRFVPGLRAASIGAGLAVLYALSGFGILLAKPVFEWELASLSVVPEIRSRVEPSVRIGSTDAGVLGYFLPNPVIQLGGLVNDREFLGYLQSRRVADYVRKEKIIYLANLADPRPDDRLVQLMGAENLQLVYQADQYVATPADWIYKLYRVR